MAVQFQEHGFSRICYIGFGGTQEVDHKIVTLETVRILDDVSSKGDG